MLSLFVSILNLILMIMLAYKICKLEDKNTKLRNIKTHAINYIRLHKDKNLSDDEILDKYFGVK